MKRIYIYLACLSGLTLGACNEQIETYSGEAGIYFAMSATKGGLDDSGQDYTSETQIPFAVYSSVTDTTLLVRAKVIGSAVDYDRQVTVQVVPQDNSELQAKEGWDYDALQNNYTVKANEVYTLIPVRFHLKSDLKDKERKLKLQLIANYDFSTPMSEWLRPNSSDKTGVDVLHHTITISDKWVQLPGFRTYFFGAYSEKKCKLICNLFGLTLLDFESEESMSLTKAKALGIKFDQYLKEQESNGQTIYEDYTDSEGNLVKMTAGEGIKY